MNTILTTVKNGARLIRFNAPKTKNAVSTPELKLLGDIFAEDAKTDDTAVTILTGTGDYFTSGNDFSRSIKMAIEKDPEEIRQFAHSARHFAAALIDYPKIAIAVVNGPAVGVGATLLGLCDAVYASDRAFFFTPFVRVGLNAEFCSSYTFPLIMGRAKAGEMLLLGHRMSAKEAYECGLVSEVFPHDRLEQVLEKVQQYGTLSVNPVRTTKKLATDSFRQALLECLERETEALIISAGSEEFADAVKAFLARKKK